MLSAYRWVAAGCLVLLNCGLLISCGTKQPTPIPTTSRAQLFASADSTLDELRFALRGWPPTVSSKRERRDLEHQWRKAQAEFEELDKMFPGEAEVEWRLGQLYRFGYNLDVPGAGQQCVAHLERAISLKPDYVDAYLELGFFYTDASPRWAALGEKNLRKAIELSGSNPLPRGWWALYLAYYYQAKFADAVAAADEYLRLVPNDPKMRQLRDQAQRAVARGSTSLEPVGRLSLPNTGGTVVLRPAAPGGSN
jgi:tetratricopeptide (TPR) repeat protein